MTQAIKSGYKQTEVGVIPEDWEEKNISNTSTMKARIGWQGLTKAEYLNTGKYYLVTGTDFNKGKINWDSCCYVEKLRFTQDKNIQLKNLDILITKDGTIGKIALVTKLNLPATLNSGVFVIRPKNNCYNSLYVFYVFNSSYFFKFLKQLVAGSTINHLYQKDFINFNFPLPKSLKEQSAIAQALSDTDNLIESLNKLISKKKNIKQGTMQLLLTGKKRLPGFSGEWEEKRLGDYVDFNKGKGLAKKDIILNGKNKCIHYGELFTIYSEKIKNIISKTNQSQNSFYSKSNDVLMPTSDVTPNGLATASCIKEDNVVLGGDVLVIRANKSDIDGLFLAFTITQNKDQIMKLVSGSTVYHLYGSDMKKYIFKSPPTIQEQTTIANILSSMDNEIELLEKERDKFKTIKTGMMQQLLTGKIRLKY